MNSVPPCRGGLLVLEPSDDELSEDLSHVTPRYEDNETAHMLCQ